MRVFDPDQVLARYMELQEKRGAEFLQLPDLKRRCARGDYEFFSSVDIELDELQREAERNGYFLEWNFDQGKNDFEYTCRKMTPEEYEDYLVWEREE